MPSKANRTLVAITAIAAFLATLGLAAAPVGARVVATNDEFCAVLSNGIPGLDSRGLDPDEAKLGAELSRKAAKTGVPAKLKRDLKKLAKIYDRIAVERSQAELDRTTAHADRGASEQERESAALDGLTGAYHRAPGRTELEREIARARRTEQPLALAYVDVDHLKATNDARGHAGGDRLLVAVANTIRAKLRPYDLIIRYGGDEFVCVVSGMCLTEVTARFSLVNAALAEGQECGSVTIGLAELLPDDASGDLIARADDDLYRERGHQPHRP